MLRHVVVTVLLLVILSGCNDVDGWKARTYPAVGEVYINGQPASGVVVLFHFLGDPPDVKESIPFGLVDDSGQYKIMTYEAYDGAPVGEYAVSLTWPPKPELNGSLDQLNGQFDSKEKSPATVKVEKGKNVLPRIDLKCKVTKKVAAATPADDI